MFELRNANRTCLVWSSGINTKFLRPPCRQPVSAEVPASRQVQPAPSQGSPGEFPATQDRTSQVEGQHRHGRSRDPEYHKDRVGRSAMFTWL